MRKKFTSRVAAVIGVATLATVGVVGVASAADPVFPPVSGIDQDQGSLTIHKFKGSPIGVENDGIEIADFPDGDPEPLQGVEFEVCQVEGLNVTTEADWANIGTLNDYVVANGALSATYMDCTDVPSATSTTDVDGRAFWDDLDLGVYFVKEVSAPVGVAESWPFLVTIPLPSNAASAPNNGWIYDVHVYPKNAIATLDMSVEDIGQAALGADVPWTITSVLPYLQFGPLPEITLTSELDSTVQYVPGSVVVKRTDSATNSETILTEGTDYTVTGPGGPGDTLVVTLNPYLFGSRDTIDVTFETTVLELTADGRILGQASMQIAGRAGPIDAVTVPTSNWGAVEILKHKEGEVGTTLEGAEFQVFATEAAARACITATATADPCENALQVWDNDAEEYLDTFTTNSSGEATIPGLNVGIDGDATSGTYYLAEIKAPPNYLLLFQPIPFEVMVNGSTVGVPTTVPVANVAESPITLPNTGAQGTLLLLVGAGLLGAGALALFASNKRKADKKG